MTLEQAADRLDGAAIDALETHLVWLLGQGVEPADLVTAALPYRRQLHSWYANSWRSIVDAATLARIDRCSSTRH